MYYNKFKSIIKLFFIKRKEGGWTALLGGMNRNHRKTGPILGGWWKFFAPRDNDTSPRGLVRQPVGRPDWCCRSWRRRRRCPWSCCESEKPEQFRRWCRPPRTTQEQKQDFCQRSSWRQHDRPRSFQEPDCRCKPAPRQRSRWRRPPWTTQEQVKCCSGSRRWQKGWWWQHPWPWSRWKYQRRRCWRRRWPWWMKSWKGTGFSVVS